MQRSKPILSLLLRRNIVSFLLIIIIVLATVFLGFEYYYKHSLVEAERKSVVSSVRSFFEMGSSLLINYNQTYRHVAERQLERLSEAYLQGGESRVREVLEQTSLENRNIKALNYYLIEKGTITRTNYAPDKGLNLAKAVPVFWDDLQEKTAEIGETYVENVSYELSTNKPRVYAYRRIDERTLFEIGLHIAHDEFDDFIENLNNLEIKSNIERVEAYNIEYVPFRESFSPLSERDREIFETLENSQQERIRDLSGSRKAMYIKWVPQAEELHSTINTRVILDFSRLSSIRNRFFLLMLLVLPILSLLMIFITYRNNRRFLGPLSRKITEINRGVPRRERSSELGTGIYELDALHSYYTGEIEKHERMNERLQEEKERAERSLRQREVLLRETHHRVKNNLNIIASLLRLQADSLEDEQIRRYFNETQNRVNSMSLIHEKLYRQDLAGLDFRQYLEDLVTQLIDTYSRPGRRIRTDFDVPDLEISLDTAIPLGLIVNELLTNSLEHGLQDAEEGTVSISIEPQEEGYLLTVRDDGSGLPDGFDATSATSLGLSLVSTLAAQLQGDFSLESDGGTVARLRFRNIEKGTEA